MVTKRAWSLRTSWTSLKRASGQSCAVAPHFGQMSWLLGCTCADAHSHSQNARSVGVVMMFPSPL